ncbi:hypothetical protein [Micromonospora globispora]|uniref:hypothetical protein n=1 Tax=Micromonospora globispora TaxID=1450148 RepID=UPI000F5F1849|nr:hypothetical protein [Micromonospora globispora]RQW84033.1 hypothetical protein DKL51_30625 [Micromonospora globispora]
MTNAKLSIAVLARVAEFLQELPEADVADLAAGRARLAVVPFGASAPRVPAARRPSRTVGAHRPAAPALDPDGARATLTAMGSRDEGTVYLSPWNAKDLRVLAAHLEMRGVTGLKKADLIDRIVDRTIGYRVNSSAIRQL